MQKSWLTLTVALGVLALGFVLTAPLHVGYYTDYNRVLREIRKHPDLEVIDGWRNDDITLEEFGFVIRSPRSTLLVNFSQDGARRPEDVADGIAIPTKISHQIGTISHTVYAYIRFDSEEWKQRGLPKVRTLADLFAHYDTVAHSLTLQPPAARVPLGVMAENAIYFNPPFVSPVGRPPPQPLSITDHRLFQELMENFTK